MYTSTDPTASVVSMRLVLRSYSELSTFVLCFFAYLCTTADQISESTHAGVS